MRILAIAALLVCTCALPLHAAERDDLEVLRATTLNLIRLLVREGVLTAEKAEALIKEAENKSATPAAAAKPVVRVPYVPEAVKQEIREEIKQEVLAQAKAERWGDPGSLPEWMDRIAFDGDLRLRFQRERQFPENAPPFIFQAFGQNINNTTEDRERWRMRGRFGLQARVNDWISGGIRLTTGSSDPVSTNQTLGNSANKYQVLVDLAYLKLDPAAWLTISGGRIPNPWFSTDLVWNDSLTFEGAALTLKPEFNENFRGFLTLGAFPLQDVEPVPTSRVSNRWLFGAQTGLELTSANQSRAKFGVALYEFPKVEGIPNTAGTNFHDLTAPQFRQKGNTMFDINAANVFVGQNSIFGLSSRFRELNLTGLIDVAAFDPVHILLTADYVKNVAFDSGEILRRTGFNIKPQTKGYAGRVVVGMPQLRQARDWQTFIGYKYLESDAVLDAYTDSDFHLGGTNAKGYFLGASYGLARNSWLTLRWLSSTEVSGLPLAIDVLQFDLNARF
jgi:Putative porin